MREKTRTFLALSVLIGFVALISTGCGTIRVFHSNIELGELDTEVTSGPDDGMSGTADDIERKRTGLRLGNDVDGGGFLQVFTEDGDAHSDDGYGVGVGASGQPRVTDLAAGMPLFLDYLFAVNLIYSQDDSGGVDTKTYYADAELRAGLAADVFAGVRPNIGVYADFVPYGKVDSDDEDVEFDGLNVGPYIGVGYASDEIALIADVRVLFGDVSGVEFSVGVQF